MWPELKELLQMPVWRKQDTAWGRITEGATLFSTLHEAVKRRAVGEAGHVAEEWDDFVKGKDEQTIRRWNTVRTLIFCADQAVNHPENYRDELGGALSLALKDPPDFLNKDTAKAFAWICVRTLLDVASRRVKVPVAGWRKEEGESGGFIAEFVLETLEKGAGQLAQHPLDSFYPLANKTQDNKDFLVSMQNAWEAARRLVKQEGGNGWFDGRWRLLDEDKPMTEASGRSASGAAALGWYHTLKGTVYDQRVIVLAQVDSKGVLKGVDGVSAKARVIAASSRFDTIVLADDENKNEAESTLIALGKLGPIRVVNIHG